MGSAGVDYLAQVASYPKPDEKLRTERLEAQGGGNCGNALTAAARLGLSPWIVTKIGDDGLGDGIISEFQRDGVATDCILRAPGAPSPFTYIIVDREGATRTCIHTPGEAFTPSEMTSELVNSALDSAAVVYFDGRLTEAALLLAEEACSRGIPVLVEGERLRPGLEDLLQEADYVVTSAHFPSNWTGEECLGNAIIKTFARLPKVKWMITTLGKKGSILLERTRTGTGDTIVNNIVNNKEGVVAEDVFEKLFEEAEDKKGREEKEKETTLRGCTSANGVEIYTGGVATTTTPVRLILRQSSEDAVAANAAAAAAAAAAANADAGNSSGYSAELVPFQPPEAIVTVAQAASLPGDAVLDTTGAGDAFIGSVLYCIATGKSPQHAQRLGAVVAACKCTALGARPGLPLRRDLHAVLL
jgi:sugar/nucleoside kinase (ribokinase family)